MGLVWVLIVAMLCSGAAAQSTTCQTAILTLAPCIDYATGKASTPPSGCCTNLAIAVSSHPECLCEALSTHTSSTGMAFNQTRIMELPGACNVKTPPFSSCNATSPAGAPAGTPTPAGSGSNTTQGDGSSGASSTKLSLSLLLLLFLASFTMY